MPTSEERAEDKCNGFHADDCPESHRERAEGPSEEATQAFWVNHFREVAGLRAKLAEAEKDRKLAWEHNAKLDGALAEEREKREKLLAAARLMESVYRQNVVQPGEPSSVLDALQAALALFHESK